MGDVDEAAVYDKALTPEQVILHYLASTSSSPAISISRDQGSVILTWTTGSLQSAPSVTGPFAPVNNAASPYSVPIPAGQAAQFYRLSVP
jgi:hypothetical protein